MYLVYGRVPWEEYGIASPRLSTALGLAGLLVLFVLTPPSTVESV